MIESVWPIGVIRVLDDRLEIRNRTYSCTMYWKSQDERDRWAAWLTRLLAEREAKKGGRPAR